MTYRIAIVGQRDAVRGFALLGVDVVPAESAAQAFETVMNLKREMTRDAQGKEQNSYAIIFVTEDFAQRFTQEETKKLAKGALPAVIPLPSHEGSTGFGMQRLRGIVEQAVGSDILQ